MLSYFSGARNLDVGYDVMFYEYDIFENACISDSFIELTIRSFSIEPFFLFINYITAQFTNNIHIALGVIALVMITFSYFACKSCIKEIPLHLLFTIYLLYYYATANNLMRQSVAVAIIFYLFTLIRSHKSNFKILIISILAILSHTSAILPIFILILYKYSESFNSQKLKTFNNFFIFICIIIFVFFKKSLYLISSITNKDYTIYSDTAMTNSEWSTPHISVTLLLFNIICIYVVYLSKKYKLLNQHDIFKFKCTISICILSVCLGKYTASASRLTLYFIIIQAFYILLCSNSHKINNENKIIYNCLTVLLFVYLYFKMFYPGIEYTSDILNIK